MNNYGLFREDPVPQTDGWKYEYEFAEREN
jgi:hypothetical protein